MRLFFLIILFSTLTSISQTQAAMSEMHQRPDAHAPIGVMADHGHHEGEFMISLRSMRMEMDGMLESTQDIAASEIFQRFPYMMTPKTMEMWMHMLGVMYGISDKWTVMAMLPYLSSSMSMERRMQGDQVESESSGLGDASLTALYTLFESEEQRLLFSLGAFLPTGSIEKERNGVRLGYPMQLGSGSVAAMPQVTYTYFWSKFSMGSQVGLKYFLQDNSANYQLGNRYLVNLWGAYQVCESFSSSLRLSHVTRDPIRGQDGNMNAMMSPVNDPTLQHGNTTSIHLGFNLLGTDYLPGHRLALEVGTPIYQDLSGPQMKAISNVTLGYQKAF